MSGDASGGGRDGRGWRSWNGSYTTGVLSGMTLILLGWGFTQLVSRLKHEDRALSPTSLRVSVSVGGLRGRPTQARTTSDLSVDPRGLSDVAMRVVVANVGTTGGIVPRDMLLDLGLPKTAGNAGITIISPLARLVQGSLSNGVNGPNASDAASIVANPSRPLVMGGMLGWTRRVLHDGVWSRAEPSPQVWRTNGRDVHIVFRLGRRRTHLDPGDAIELNVGMWLIGDDAHHIVVPMDAQVRHEGAAEWTEGTAHVSPGERLEMMLYTGNFGNGRVKGLRLRLHLPRGLSLVPGSGRVSYSGEVAPLPVYDEIASQSTDFGEWGPDVYGYFKVVVRVSRHLRAGTVLHPSWSLSGENLGHGSEPVRMVVCGTELAPRSRRPSGSRGC